MVGQEQRRRALGQLEHGHPRPEGLDREDQPRAELVHEPSHVGRGVAARHVDEVEALEGGQAPPSMRYPPIGARGLEPQNTWVPTIPTRWTSTVLSTIDLAV